MKRVLISLVLASCADPAALEVRIAVRDQDLDDIRLNVLRGDQASSTSFIDCTLPLDGEPTGACPFEAGTDAWTDPEQLSFVLYGDPDTPLIVEVDGFRAGRSVTATRAVSALPPSEGERRRIDLALFSRTSERLRCGVAIPDGSTEPISEDDNALAVFEVLPNRFARELIVSANANLVFTRILRTAEEEGCRFDPVVAYDGAPSCTRGDAPVRWCHLRPGAMAVGPVRSAGDDELNPILVGGVCQTPEHLIAAFIRGRCADVRIARMPADIVISDVSDPVIADVDRDGDYEVITTFVNRVGLGPTEPAPVSVIVWHPEKDRDAVETTLLPNTFSRIAHSPMYFASGDRTTLLFTATTPPLTVLTEGRFLPVTGIETFELARAPVLVAGTTSPGLVRARVDGVVEWLSLMGGRDRWRATTVARYGLDRSLAVDLDVRIAVGRLAGDEVRSAVIVDDGELLTLPLIEGVSAPPRRTFWGMGVAQGPQYALLANIDGAPGAEIVSHSREAPQLHSVDHTAARLEGWPISMTSQTGRRHVVITDLDGPFGQDAEGTALRDLEVVTLSGNQLEVITLGPGSYEVTGTPWPAADHDPLRSGTYTGEADVHQILNRSVQP